MVKSTFFKYLITFSLIIFLSFLMLTSIITSMIRAHVTADKTQKLEMSSLIVADYFIDRGVENLENSILHGDAPNITTLMPIISLDYDFHILVADAEGDVLLSTLAKDDADTDKPHGKINITEFDEMESPDGEKYFVYKGKIEGVVDHTSIIYAKEIVTKGEKRGYAISLATNVIEDRLITVVRSTVFNCSIWIMLAAVIASYFITERISHPLKTMTGAAKRFAKGDFSERLTVRGNDEVAELAAALNHMAESLESLESMRNSFLASVSHDLRTPMTTISGFIDGITSGAIPEEQQAHYLGVISSEVHRLSRLVGQLLDISRLESGDRKFNMESFDICEVARLIIISFEKQLENRALDVDFDVEEDNMPVLADKDAIYQVLYNLCHNAIKFSRENGRFIIKISRLAGKKLRVSVYDDGQVLSEEDAAHIFDRFYKSDKSRGLDKSGVGLGLYICKTIIDAHDEQIYVETHPDGCEFWFTLKEGTPIVKHK